MSEEIKQRYNPRAGQKKVVDYKEKYAKEKTKNWEVRTTTIGATIPKSLNDDFIQKCEFEGKTKSHKIRELIEHYTYGINNND